MALKIKKNYLNFEKSVQGTYESTLGKNLQRVLDLDEPYLMLPKDLNSVLSLESYFIFLEKPVREL